MHVAISHGQQSPHIGAPPHELYLATDAQPLHTITKHRIERDRTTQGCAAGDASDQTQLQMSPCTGARREGLYEDVLTFLWVQPADVQQQRALRPSPELRPKCVAFGGAQVQTGCRGDSVR